MASSRQIKSRIRSVKSNKQITKAMELVAASKLRKSQEAANNSRSYADMARDILQSLAQTHNVVENDLFATRDVRSRMIIVITSDRGLAGAYNANVIKQLTQLLKSDEGASITTKVLTIGKKGAQFVSKLSTVDSIGAYDMADVATQSDIRAIISTAIEQFRNEDVDQVDVIGTKFVNSFTQTAYSETILPVGRQILEADEEADPYRDMKFEPDVDYVLRYAIVRLVEAQLYQALLDSTASEHAMRRVAMKNASDNAADIVDALTLEMNKVRQSAITQELSEISAGVEAMK